MNLTISLSTARGDDERRQQVREGTARLTELINALNEVGAGEIHVTVNAYVAQGQPPHPMNPGGY